MKQRERGSPPGALVAPLEVSTVLRCAPVEAVCLRVVAHGGLERFDQGPVQQAYEVTLLRGITRLCPFPGIEAFNGAFVTDQRPGMLIEWNKPEDAFIAQEPLATHPFASVFSQSAVHLPWEAMLGRRDVD